jgi:hypothetical protein
MKIKISLFLLLTSFSILANAQKKPDVITKPDMPIDEETKIVSYKGVVELSGVSKDELYARAYHFFKSYYKNPSQVIQTADAAGGKIEGKAQFATYKTLKNGVKAQADMIKYSISIMVKDGKYKYEITKINIQSASYKPIETYFSETDPLRDEHWETLTQADDVFNTLVGLIKEAMEKPSTSAKKEDW